MKTKNIKVVYTSRYSQSLGIRHTGTGPCTAVPKIQMEGRWLEQLGFTIGAPLIVELKWPRRWYGSVPLFVHNMQESGTFPS